LGRGSLGSLCGASLAGVAGGAGGAGGLLLRGALLWWAACGVAGGGLIPGLILRLVFGLVFGLGGGRSWGLGIGLGLIGLGRLGGGWVLIGEAFGELFYFALLLRVGGSIDVFGCFSECVGELLLLAGLAGTLGGVLEGAAQCIDGVRWGGGGRFGGLLGGCAGGLVGGRVGRRVGRLGA
jgi:hypothetical protein